MGWGNIAFYVSSYYKFNLRNGHLNSGEQYDNNEAKSRFYETYVKKPVVEGTDLNFRYFLHQSAPKMYQRLIKWSHIGAIIMVLMSSVLFSIAFGTPGWLRARPGTQEMTRFKSIGLWEGCFDHYRHFINYYGREYQICRWLWAPEYANLMSWIETPWFQSCQALAIIVLILLIVESILLFISIGVMKCFTLDYDPFFFQEEDYADYAYKRSSGFFKWITFLSWLNFTLLGAIILIFGINADDRSWMPQPPVPKLHYFSYSYIIACCCTGFMLFASIGMSNVMYYLVGFGDELIDSTQQAGSSNVPIRAMMPGSTYTGVSRGNVSGKTQQTGVYGTPTESTSRPGYVSVPRNQGGLVARSTPSVASGPGMARSSPSVASPSVQSIPYQQRAYGGPAAAAARPAQGRQFVPYRPKSRENLA